MKPLSARSGAKTALEEQKPILFSIRAAPERFKVPKIPRYGYLSGSGVKKMKPIKKKTGCSKTVGAKLKMVYTALNHFM